MSERDPKNRPTGPTENDDEQTPLPGTETPVEEPVIEPGVEPGFDPSVIERVPQPDEQPGENDETNQTPPDDESTEKE